MRLMIFIDGSYLWHSSMSQCRPQNIKMDLAELPRQLMEAIPEFLTTRLSYAGTILNASIPVNTDKRDIPLVKKRYNFFKMLEDTCGYQVELSEIDFRGRRLLKQDRGIDSWEPKEKCVDIEIASNLFFYKDKYDMAILITGDKDFLPALTKVQQLGKQVKIASFQSSCSNKLVETFEDIIWLDNLLPKMLLNY